MNVKHLKSLKLTDEQIAGYLYYHDKEKRLKRALRDCRVSENAIDKIVDVSDLDNVSDNDEILRNEIKKTWNDLMIKGATK